MISRYGCGKELTLDTVESPRYKLVPTEDEGPMTIGSPLVLVDVTELFRSTFTCEYPDVEAEGPRDKVKLAISVNQPFKTQTMLLREKKALQDGESVWGSTSLPGG